MEGSQSGSAIVYYSSIGQHCYGAHHGAPMTDTSSFGLAMGICIIAVHLDVRPFLCSTILSATTPCVHTLPDAVTFQSLLCSMCYLVGQIVKSSLLPLLLGDADLRCACKHHCVGSGQMQSAIIDLSI